MFHKLCVLILVLSVAVGQSRLMASDISEVWIGLEADLGIVRRHAPDGSLISTFSLLASLSDMAQLDDVVLINLLNTGRIDRHDSEGNLLNEHFALDVHVSELVQVNDEAWVATTFAPGMVKRYDASGSIQSEISTGNPRAAEVAVVGSEIWVGLETDLGMVHRYDSSGQFLGSFAAGASLTEISRIEDEVWIGTQNHSHILRFDFSGNDLGRFDVGGLVTEIVQVGNEAWVGLDISTGVVEQYDLNRNYISEFAVGQRIVDMMSLAVVPEPASMIHLMGALTAILSIRSRPITH